MSTVQNQINWLVRQVECLKNGECCQQEEVVLPDPTFYNVLYQDNNNTSTPISDAGDTVYYIPSNGNYLRYTALEAGRYRLSFQGYANVPDFVGGTGWIAVEVRKSLTQDLVFPNIGNGIDYLDYLHFPYLIGNTISIIFEIDVLLAANETIGLFISDANGGSNTMENNVFIVDKLPNYNI